jgi:hypothetical protein
MSNTDDVVKYVLSNAKDLPADKISSLAKVIRALGRDIPPEPNDVPQKDDENLADESGPIDFSKVKSVEIDGREMPIEIER